MLNRESQRTNALNGAESGTERSDGTEAADNGFKEKSQAQQSWFYAQKFHSAPAHWTPCCYLNTLKQTLDALQTLVL